MLNVVLWSIIIPYCAEENVLIDLISATWQRNSGLQYLGEMLKYVTQFYIHKN